MFVIVSDHSHFNQRDIGIEDKEYHRIVCMFYGDVIKDEFRGKKYERTVSQLDVAPTVAKQFGLEINNYPFGKNMLNPYSPAFAYFDYHYGSGFVTDSCYVSYNDISDELMRMSCPDSVTLKKLSRNREVILQNAFRDYLSR